MQFLQEMLKIINISKLCAEIFLVSLPGLKIGNIYLLSLVSGTHTQVFEEEGVGGTENEGKK